MKQPPVDLLRQDTSEEAVMGAWYAPSTHGYGSPPKDATPDELSACEAAAEAWWAEYRAGKTATPTTSTRAEFMASLPPLNSRRNARRYITRVAQGFQAGHVDAKEVKAMLYTAQLALAASPTPTPRPLGGGKRKLLEGN